MWCVHYFLCFYVVCNEYAIIGLGECERRGGEFGWGRYRRSWWREGEGAAGCTYVRRSFHFLLPVVFQRIAYSFVFFSAAKSETYQVDTTDILFILSGAFVGLDKVVQQRMSKGVRTLSFTQSIAIVTRTPLDSDRRDLI